MFCSMTARPVLSKFSLTLEIMFLSVNWISGRYSLSFESVTHIQ